MIRMGSAWFDVTADSRGNRLVNYRATRTKDGRQHFINAKCCSEVGTQVKLALEGLNPVAMDPTDKASWTCQFRFDGPYTETIRDALDLLKDVLTLRGEEELDGALALDFYKIPDPEIPSDQWDETVAGGLVRRGKYSLDLSSGKKLADLIAAAITNHPAYASSDAVLSIPGTQHDFGERLARGVASRLGVPCLASRRAATLQNAAKTGRVDTHLEELSVDGDVDGQRLVIVDDVYRSGISMRSVAAAARQAAASTVFGVVGARTMRN
jgi:hypothetical protein